MVYTINAIYLNISQLITQSRTLYSINITEIGIISKLINNVNQFCLNTIDHHI